MLRDLDLVNIQQAMEGARELAPDTWLHLEAPSSDDEVCWGIVEKAVAQIVCFRGSIVLEDFFRDAVSEEAVTLEPPWGTAVGRVPAGFTLGLIDAYSAIVPMLDKSKDLIVIGHSLGAARALILSGMLVSNGQPPKEIVTWGSPMPGMAALKTLLGPIIQRSYRNRRDPICDVPIPIELWPYCHPSALIEVDGGAPGPNDDPKDLFFSHHIANYAKAMLAIGA